eukprot:CAMPEP_0116866346 /NCGR_PEP_ID=MMETSP0418-20121206/25970_1 /TAXON_ID=1158023 /ORGANISM="Astrosyne radiata, Strain 13vi08-1A" /LENGTH=405 /DNA_ID=CAMNT_0004501955 /DNA_START=343 /DNA_END=1560 /DNA_ORIENTATION=-
MFTPRLVPRNLPYFQSRNELQIEIPKQRPHLKGLRKEDWFHVILRTPTFVSIFILLVVWTSFILAFAVMYKIIDDAYGVNTNCGLGPLHFGGYFAFSLETTTTVGYGLPGSTNSFFENCPWIQVAIYMQMVWSMMYNAFLFAFFFSRLGKVESRASQVIFSDKALIRKSTNGERWEFMFRVTDMDSAHPIVEAHVRMFARKGIELIPLRILNPNDDLGAALFLSWPTVVTHHIDVHSPLHPPSPRRIRLRNAGLHLREADSVTANREEIICPICSETFGDIERLRCHVAYNQIVEAHDGIPVEGSHQSLNLEDLVLPDPPTEEDLKKSFPREIVVLVEGIDPLMSGTFQAIQSYTLEDVVFGGKFAECILTGKTKYRVSLEKFQDLDEEEILGSTYQNKAEQSPV